MKKDYIAYGVVGVITIATLGFVPGVMFPYVAGKLMIALGGMALISLCCAVFVITQQVIAKPSWITKGFLVISILTLLSSIWSSNGWMSIGGSDGRGEGFLGVLVITLLSFFLDQLEESKKRWVGEKIIALSSLVTMYGVYELLRDTAHRSEGFHGNSILFAMYCVSILGLCVVLYVREKKWIGIPGALSLGALLATQTRGILLAVIIAGIVWGIRYVVQSGSAAKRNMLYYGLAGLVMVGFGLRYVDTHTQILQEKLPFIHRIVSLDNTLDSDKQRVFIWNTAWNAFKERPWLGYGSQMFYQAFDTHYDARLTRYGYSQVWSDRAHNVYLDILVMYGLLGVIVYGGFGVVLIKKIKTIEKKNEVIAIGVGLGIAYLFEFTGVADMIVLVSLLHIISENKREEKKVPKEMAVVFLIPLLLLVVVYQWYGTSRNVAMALAQSVSQDATNEALEKINNTQLYKRDYLLRVADLAFRTLQKTETDTQNANNIVRALDQYLQKYPTDVAMLVAQGNIQLKIASVYNDENALEKADATYAHASELAPNKQTMYLQRANGKVLKKDFDEAEKLWAQAYELDPDNHMIAYQFGYALLMFDRPYESSTVLRAYFDKFANEHVQFVPTDEKELTTIAQSALQINNIDLLAYALACLVEQNNQNIIAKENLEKAISSGQLQEVTVKGIEKILTK